MIGPWQKQGSLATGSLKCHGINSIPYCSVTPIALQFMFIAAQSSYPIRYELAHLVFVNIKVPYLLQHALLPFRIACPMGSQSTQGSQHGVFSPIELEGLCLRNFFRLP